MGHLRYDSTTGHLKYDPATGHLIHACPSIYTFVPQQQPDNGFCWSSGQDVYTSPPLVEASFADAVADIPNYDIDVGPMIGWGAYYTVYTPDPPDPEFLATVEVTASGYAYNSGWLFEGEPSSAVLSFDWQHADSNWPEGFDIQIRIRAGTFSHDTVTAIAQGVLIGTLHVTNGGSDSEEFILDAAARAECDVEGGPTLLFSAVPTSTPDDDPPYAGIQGGFSTSVTISNVRMLVS